jgi:hypothetical protein
VREVKSTYPSSSLPDEFNRGSQEIQDAFHTLLNGRQLESFIKEGTQKDLDTVTRIYHKWYGLRKIGMVLKGYTQGVNDFQMLRVDLDDAYRGLQNRLHPTGNKLSRFFKKLIGGIPL